MSYLNRQQWGATTPLGPRVDTPVSKVFIHHTVTNPTADPARDARTLDAIGRSRFGIFSYSWAIHPDGTIIEGAGLHRGAHTGGYNSTSFGIAFIGNFETTGPTKEAMFAAANLIKFLKLGGKVTRNVEILPHRSVKSTACPGRNLYNALPMLRSLVNASPNPPAPVQHPEPPKVDPVTDLRAIADAITRASASTYRRGSRGDGVKWIQALLKNRGYPVSVDGIFGPNTERMVRHWQGANGLVADGIVGPRTWAILR